jgi:hypothetical protein
MLLLLAAGGTSGSEKTGPSASWAAAVAAAAALRAACMFCFCAELRFFPMRAVLLVRSPIPGLAAEGAPRFLRACRCVGLLVAAAGGTCRNCSQGATVRGIWLSALQSELQYCSGLLVQALPRPGQPLGSGAAARGSTPGETHKACIL